MRLLRSIWEILVSKYLTKSVENRLHLERRLYNFQLKRGTSISDHINNYTKLLTDLANLDVVIDDEDKALILLNSLLDEGYETFVLILINGRTSLNHSGMITALVNLELRRKDKECSSSDTLVDVLVAREYSLNRKRENLREGKKKLRMAIFAGEKKRGIGVAHPTHTR